MPKSQETLGQAIDWFTDLIASEDDKSTAVWEKFEEWLHIDPTHRAAFRSVENVWHLTRRLHEALKSNCGEAQKSAGRTILRHFLLGYSIETAFSVSSERSLRDDVCKLRAQQAEKKRAPGQGEAELKRSVAEIAEMRTRLRKVMQELAKEFNLLGAAMYLVREKDPVVVSFEAKATLLAQWLFRGLIRGATDNLMIDAPAPDLMTVDSSDASAEVH